MRWCFLILAGAGAGCQREEIQVYTAPKDPPRAVRAVDSHAVDSPSRAPRAKPQVTWTLPQGWKESAASQMSVASFAIQDTGGLEAQVTITPLGRLAGHDTQLVNMWREAVGLEPLDAEEAAKQFESVEVGGESGRLFQIEGRPKDGSGPARIVTAMVHRADATWFYKLAGDAALVVAQKPAFLEFLKSIRIKEAPAPSAAETSPDGGSRPNWTVPGQWKEMPPGQMQLAKFAVPQRGSAKAEVSVSVFPNDTGGTLANVNRWRNQIGLPEVKEGELSAVVSALDPAAPGAMLTDMKSGARQLLGAIVPRDGRYWFYKLMGDAEAVTPEKESFIAFATSKP
jgi:hypothetical protein